MPPLSRFTWGYSRCETTEAFAKKLNRSPANGSICAQTYAAAQDNRVRSDALWLADHWEDYTQNAYSSYPNMNHPHYVRQWCRKQKFAWAVPPVDPNKPAKACRAPCRCAASGLQNLRECETEAQFLKRLNHRPPGDDGSKHNGSYVAARNAVLAGETSANVHWMITVVIALRQIG